MRRQVSFRRPDRDGFLLDTADVAEARGFWHNLLGLKARPKSDFSRYISSNNTHEGQMSEVEADRRSWKRFWLALIGVVVVWLLGAML
ncbi:MAG: hypothetical protein ACI4RT_09470 [Candidatus Spyradenecus sp.]